MDSRKLKGRQIAGGARIRKTAGLWLVPSQSHAGTYVVDSRHQSCSCPDHETRAVKCKHLWAVEYARRQVTQPDGSKVVTESLRVTYGQDWAAYNAAQCSEKEAVQELLRELCACVPTPAHVGRGRPPLPLGDVVYGATMKVYTTLSGRRASSDLRDCEAKGLMDQAPSYNAIFAYLDKPELTPVLRALIETSAAPLRAVEHDFAVDATGFSTSVYRRWYDHKYGREMKEHTWVKAHAIVGVSTHIIASAVVTDGDAHDSPEFAALAKGAARNFDVREVSADKAYLSHENLAVVEALGATPYVPFKVNSQGEGSEAWARLWHLFCLNRPKFLEHYHKRSNVESAFSAVKRKFGGAVRSKKATAQVNETLCKLLCHNLSMLVHAMAELGVDPCFNRAA